MTTPHQDLSTLPILQPPATSPVMARLAGTHAPATLEVPHNGWAHQAVERLAHPMPEPVPTREGGDYGEGIDWAAVAQFRGQVSARLTEISAAEDLTPPQQKSRGQEIIRELLEDDTRRAIAAGTTVRDVVQEERMAIAIYDAVFRMGRLQPLLEDERVENIEIYGCNHVVLEDQDGRLREGPRVAETDQELIEFLAFIASRSEANARAFSEATPRLHLRLDGGERLAAVAWVTPRPQVVIRRHRLREVTLDDLVARQTLSPAMASFLAAAIRAQKSIVVVGEQGAGKTTLVRALCAEIPNLERIATFETEYELHLHELTNRHKRVLAFESRPGTGERGIDGRQAGEITLSDLIIDSFRFNVSRLIVGEVRGPEVFAMVKAMQSGTGSISTTHAKNARMGIEKLVTCAMEAGPHVTHDYAVRAVASGIDLIVYVELDTSSKNLTDDTYRRRYVSEVIGVGLSNERGVGYDVHDIFTPNPHGGPGLPRHLPLDDDLLVRHGFDIALFNQEAHR